MIKLPFNLKCEILGNGSGSSLRGSIRAMQLVMTLLLALEAGDLHKWGFGTCSGHGGRGGIRGRNALAGLFIEQARDNEIEGERVRGNSIKGNNE